MVRMLAAFDAHDIRAEIGQEPGAKGTGEHMGKIQDAHAGERRGVVR